METPAQNTDQELTPPNPVTEVDPHTVQSVLLGCSRMAGKFISDLALARKKLSGAKRALEQHEADLYEKHRWSGNKRWTKDEIEKYCFPKDERWRTLATEVEKQQALAEYCENSIKAIKDQGWNIRSYIDYLRYLEGEGRSSRQGQK